MSDVDLMGGEGAERKLTPANENPWYVLMTLYGEQEGEEVDEELHEKNRAAWNAWACQGMGEEEREKVGKSSNVTDEELSAWKKIKATIAQLHRKTWFERNIYSENYPGLPNFGMPIDCEGCLFMHRLCANSFVFSRATYFETAVFTGDASFRNVTFYKRATFRRAVFNQRVVFMNSIFLDAAIFVDTNFQEFVTFISARFEGNAFFNSAQFGNPNESQGVNLSGSEFAKPTNFSNAKFHACYPTFIGAIQHEKTIFTAHPENWPRGSQTNPAQAKASCAAIRHNLGKQGLPEAEHFFFRREMGFAAQIGGWWERLPYRLFGLLSDFGYSIARPALWLIGMFIVIGMINHVVLQWGASLGAASLHGMDYHPVQAFALSFSNEFPLFGLQARWFEVSFLAGLNPWLKFFGGVQTVVALPLLFFLGLGLRTRFRMR